MANEPAVDESNQPGGTFASHPEMEVLPVFVSPSTQGKGKNTIRMELIAVACWKLDDVRFAFASSFPLPAVKHEFAGLSQLIKKHPKSPLSVFGHADPVGDDNFNKALSGDRAIAIYSVLVRDAARWEKLYISTGSAEGWGTPSIQQMLIALGFNPGPVDGVNGPKTQAAVKEFQNKKGLAADGVAGPATREKLFLAYMDFLCADKLAKTEFLGQGADPNGKADFQGCSEFNPNMVFSKAEEANFSQPGKKAERDQENGVNRRVMVLLFRPGTTVPVEKWPCPRAGDGSDGCRKRFWSDGETRRSPQAARRKFGETQDTFACRFYHRLVTLSPCEGVLPKLQWIQIGLLERPKTSTKPWWVKNDRGPYPDEPWTAKLTNGPQSGKLDKQGISLVNSIPAGLCGFQFTQFFLAIENEIKPAEPWPANAVPGQVIPPGPLPGPTPPKKENLVLRSVDSLFAPGIEQLEIVYDVDSLEGKSAHLQVESTRIAGTILFERDLTVGEMTTGAGKKLTWDGKAAAGVLSGKFVDPAHSPYKVTLKLSDGRFLGSKETKVEVDKVTTTLESKDNKIVFNDPEGDVLAQAKVLIKKKAGGSAVTPIDIAVTFTFTPKGANVSAADSFVYDVPGSKKLGKKGDAAAIYWKAHPDSSATSPDGFKTKCVVQTIMAAGAGQGIAKVNFQPSGVGGNKYKIKGEIFAADGTTSLANDESAETTIIRKTVFAPHEMAGQTHVSTNGTTAKIAPFYTAATFVDYTLGVVTKIDAAHSVKYIGLWDHATSAQLNWATHRAKAADETPTAAETADANGPAGAKQTAARAAIKLKAEKWRDRIVAVLIPSTQAWPVDSGIPIDTMIGVEFWHPKFSADAPNADSVTTEWTAFPWLQIEVGDDVPKVKKHPDTRWENVQGFAFEKRAYAFAGTSAARAKVVIAHEAGHDTKNRFKRELFGPGDHSAAAGLMDQFGSLDAFTAREIEILRGLK